MKKIKFNVNSEELEKNMKITMKKKIINIID